jgi:hypothetical protein
VKMYRSHRRDVRGRFCQQECTVDEWVVRIRLSSASFLQPAKCRCRRSLILLAIVQQQLSAATVVVSAHCTCMPALHSRCAYSLSG